MRFRTLCFVACLAVLGGCTTMTPQERRAADEAACRDYGFRAGTDAFAECLQRTELDRRQARRAQVYREPAFVHRPVVVYRPAPPPRPRRR